LLDFISPLESLISPPSLSVLTKIEIPLKPRFTFRHVMMLLSFVVIDSSFSLHSYHGNFSHYCMTPEITQEGCHRTKNIRMLGTAKRNGEIGAASMMESVP